MQTSVCLISLEHTNKGTNQFLQTARGRLQKQGGYGILRALAQQCVASVRHIDAPRNNGALVFTMRVIVGGQFNEA
jgi:hypothetical protein